jgi:LysM repeat protein
MSSVSATPGGTMPATAAAKPGSQPKSDVSGGGPSGADTATTVPDVNTAQPQGPVAFAKQFLPSAIYHSGDGWRGALPDGYVHPEDTPGILFNPDQWFGQGAPQAPGTSAQPPMPPTPPPTGWSQLPQPGSEPGTWRYLRQCSPDCVRQGVSQLGQCPPAPPPVPPPGTPGSSTKPGTAPKTHGAGDSHAATQTYTVKSGDTLSSIGQHFGVPWQRIYKANKGVIGSNPNFITPGERLKIPGSQAAPTPAPAPPPAHHGHHAHHPCGPNDTPPTTVPPPPPPAPTGSCPPKCAPAPKGDTPPKAPPSGPPTPPPPPGSSGTQPTPPNGGGPTPPGA